MSGATARLRGLRAGLAQSLPAEWLESFDDQAQGLVGKIGAFLVGAFTHFLVSLPQLVGILLVPVLAFYLVKDRLDIETWILSWIPERRRDMWARLLAVVDQTLAAYVRGQGMVCLIQAFQSTLVFTIVGLPYASVVGLVAGLGELLPMVGGIVVTAVILLVGMPQGGWVWLRAFGAYFILNQILAYVITPRIMRRQVELHPVGVLLAVAAGAELGGLPGVLFALPLTAALRAALEAWRAERRQQAAAAPAVVDG